MTAPKALLMSPRHGLKADRGYAAYSSNVTKERPRTAQEGRRDGNKPPTSALAQASLVNFEESTLTTPLIIRDFHFTRDFRSINWRATLWYNLTRATMAGVVLAAVNAVVPGTQANLLLALAAIPMMPIAYVLVILPVTLLVSLFRWVPFVGVIQLAVSFVVAIGDPLVCLLKRIKPEAVPVDDPTLFSLTPVFWVLDAQEHAIAG